MRARAERLTDPAILAEYGGGAFPLLIAMEKGEVAANGNYMERDELAVGHGVCGDPEQVRSIELLWTCVHLVLPHPHVSIPIDSSTVL